MRKRIISLLLLAAHSSSLLASHVAAERPEFTREQELQTRNGAFVVQSGSDGLFTVTLTNRTLDIKPTNSKFKPCKGLPVDPFEDVIEGEVRATFLNDEVKQKMVIWGIRRTEIGSANPKRIVVSYTMLFVDLQECKSKALWLPDEEIDSTQQLTLPKVQRHYYTTSVYYASQRQCSPCVFDSKMGRISKGNRLIPEEAVPGGRFYLHQLEPVDDSFGYFYAYNFVNDTSVIKLLNSNYEVKWHKQFEHPVDSVFVKAGRIRNVGYCYAAVGSPKELRCDRLDSRLKSVLSVLVPLDQPAQKVVLVYHEQGNFFVSVVLPTGVRVFVYDIIGKLLATLDFGLLQGDQRVRDFSAYAQDKEYCLFYSVAISQAYTNNILRCIDTTKYIV